MPTGTASSGIVELTVGEFEDESVVSLDPVVRRAIERAAPAPSAKWKFYLYRDYFLIRVY